MAPTIAAPRICSRGRRCYAQSRYPSHGEYLWRDVAEINVKTSVTTARQRTKSALILLPRIIAMRDAQG